jgi:2-amino-4-hydroxy-6-hydroxymethyldihydropteridine diphosphokinase
MSNNLVYIELGGNIGDTKTYFDKALNLISGQAGKIIKLSSVYQTAPWGFDAHQPFLNQVLGIETELEPEAFLSLCLSIENQLGRKRGTDGYIPRTIDIDILLWDNQVIDLPNLKVPHPLMGQRRFVLEPLCEIAPDFIHPVTRSTIRQMLVQCPDNLECKKSD